MKSLSRPFSLDKHSKWKNKLCFQEFFDSLIIKIFSCLICTLIITFENAYCVFVCMFEKYGGDPLKRSMKNQVMIQIWYTGIISNNICTPLLTWRILFGTLNPYIAIFESFWGNFFISWSLLCITETNIIKVLMISKFSYMAGINDDFMGTFFLCGNIGFLFLCHISR